MSFATVFLGETVYLDFITSSPTTGAAADADSGPTAAVYENATDTANESPTVTKRTSLTGNYRMPLAVTTANGYEIGKSYSVIASATVGGVAAKVVAGRFIVRPAEYIFVGTAASGAAGTVTLASPASTTLDFYKGIKARIVDGTGVGQERFCTTASTGRVLTVAPNWVTNPNSTSVVALFYASGVDVEMVANVAAVPGAPDVNVVAVAGTAQTAGDLAALINALALYTTRVVARCTASGTPSTTSIPTSACAPAGSAADQFKGRVIIFDATTTTVALRGQATDITASSAAATPTFTVTALTTAPVSGDTFTIV